MTRPKLTIEPHGYSPEGIQYAVYEGREEFGHGNRLFNVTDPTPAGLALMQKLLDTYNSQTFEVKRFKTDNDWCLEIHADGVRIADGYPAPNCGRRVQEMVDLANEAIAARKLEDRASQVREKS